MPTPDWLSKNSDPEGTRWAEIFIRRTAELSHVPMNYIDKLLNLIIIAHSQPIPFNSEASKLLHRGNAESILEKATRSMSRSGRGVTWKRFLRKLLQERSVDKNYKEYE